jgi:hypothetical protein
MKFSYISKTIMIIVLFSSQSLISLINARELSADIPQYRNKQKSTITQGKNFDFENFRFVNSKLKSKANAKSKNKEGGYMTALREEESQNIFIMNTEPFEDKPAAASSEREQEVNPRSARSGTYYHWGFAWWTFLAFPPENTINGRSFSYWLSKDGVKEDYIEYSFDIPTKLDSMLIHWRLAPTSFKLEFRVKDDGPLIPLTNKILKFEKITKDGKKGSLSQVSEKNAFKFNKPIFVKSLRITMNDPLKSNKFSIFKTRFFNIITTMMIVNQTIDPCKQYCFYINTDKPRDGTAVEAVDCLSGMSTADNRELFQYYSDRSVRNYNSKHCVGFDPLSKEVVLRDCLASSAYKINTNEDNSLSFVGYEKDCLYLDNSSNKSANFVDDKTQVFATSEFDKEVYKKENILSKS